MIDQLTHRYRISVRAADDVDSVEHRLNDLGFRTVNKRRAFHSLEIEGPQSAKTKLSRVPGVEHVIYIHVQRGD